ncbi:MAG: AmmeMemoRadiSam system radical SAM enzyme [Desulfobacterales bacterium]
MEALLYEALKNRKVRCNLCSHRCIIKDGSRGICRVRENRSGKLYSLVYGQIIARNIDPIEKKPIFHLSPGSLSYSVATCGCNFKCRFCQNADIAQMPSNQREIIMGRTCSPQEIVDDAARKNCKTIAYTYTEPTVFFEFAYETATLAKKRGIKNIFVTNGYMTSEMLQMAAPLLDAANVDLKSYNNDFYKTYCEAKLEPVKETMRQMKSLGILLEITTLLIPGLNDDASELEGLANFIAHDLGVDTPWHISRFHPTYKMTNRPMTPLETIKSAREIGLKAGLRYVYTGNVPGEPGGNTFCYNCGEILIERYGFHVEKNMVKNSRCTFCNAAIDGVDLSH